MSVLLSNSVGVAATQVKTMIGSLTPEAGVVRYQLVPTRGIAHAPVHFEPVKG